jgi:hypothetical protein
MYEAELGHLTQCRLYLYSQLSDSPVCDLKLPIVLLFFH